MQIAWNGLGSYVFSTKTAQGDVTLVTNPFVSGDIKFPRSQVASIVVSSHNGDDARSYDALTSEYPEDKRCPFNVEHAGEYEIRGVAVTGVYVPKKDASMHAIYRIDVEAMSIGFLGAIDRVLTEKEVEALGNIDVLIIPAVKELLSASMAAEIVALIEPRMVIPSYTDDASALCRELSSPTESTAKLKLTRAVLPEEDMKIVTFTR